jgi:polyhydroxyalkanoate synthesis regulator phasin
MGTAAENREKLYGIRRRMLRGEISYEAAKAEAQPLIDAINKKNAEIAKKHGKRAGKISFAAVMR